MIRINNVTKIFNKKAVLKEVNLTINKGEIVALVGPNGAGKTTLISLILGLLKPTKGNITLFEEKVTEKRNKEKIGVMMQDNIQMNHVKVKEIIELYRSYYSAPLSTEAIYQLTNLEEEQSFYSNKLSGGQSRRLNFGLAMVGNPEIVFLDEPTAGMDVISRQNFWLEMNKIVAQGKTIVLTTHYLEEVEKVANRIVVLHEGCIIHDGTMDKLRKEMNKKQIILTYLGEQPSDLEQLAEVQAVKQIGKKMVLETNNSDKTIKDLIEKRIPFEEIKTHTNGLDEIFTELVTENGGKLNE